MDCVGYACYAQSATHTYLRTTVRDGCEEGGTFWLGGLGHTRSLNDWHGGTNAINGRRTPPQDTLSRKESNRESTSQSPSLKAQARNCVAGTVAIVVGGPSVRSSAPTHSQQRYSATSAWDVIVRTRRKAKDGSVHMWRSTEFPRHQCAASVVAAETLVPTTPKARSKCVPHCPVSASHGHAARNPAPRLRYSCKLN